MISYGYQGAKYQICFLQKHSEHSSEGNISASSAFNVAAWNNYNDSGAFLCDCVKCTLRPVYSVCAK